MSALVRALCLPLEAMFRVAVAIRARGYDRGYLRTTVAPIPVISVGNLTVGGTGKTPLTAWMAGVLTEAGARPAILSRGYGQDELDLHRAWNPDVPVVVAPRRADGVEQAVGKGATVALLDDGFQHRALARDLDVVILAAEQPFPGAMLPRGPYREPPGALSRADLVVVTRKTATPARSRAVTDRIANLRPNLPVFEATLRPSAWTDLDGGAAPPPSHSPLAVASIAEPETFRGLVQETTAEPVDLLTFRDHHPYTAEDVRDIQERAAGRVVVTTEKDAVKLQAFRDQLGDVRVLKLDVRFPQGASALRETLIEAANRSADP